MRTNVGFISKFSSVVGEHPFKVHGPVGVIEGVCTIPESFNTSYIALIGHPHSLHGGAMNNKVVTTLVRAFKELSLISIRFNFRGVGQTEGVFDAGIGESDDMLFLTKLCLEDFPHLLPIFSGFSFGSFVAYRCAAQCQSKLLITIAPPVHHFDYKSLDHEPSPWLIVQGEEDDIVPKSIVENFVTSLKKSPEVIFFPKTGHFFHGQLINLKKILIHHTRHLLNLKI